CMQNLNDGTIDLLPDVAYSPERNTVFDFNQIPVLNSWSQVYANPKSKILVFRDLQEKRIALVAGSIQQNNFSNMMKGYGYTYETINAQSFFEAFSMAGIGLADAAVTNNYFGDLNMKTYQLERTNLIFDPVMLFFAVRKGENAGLIESIDRYLVEWIKTSGSVYYQALERLDNPVLQTESRSSRIWNWIIAGLIVLAACIIIILQYRINSSTRQLRQMNRKLQAGESKFRSYIENSPYGVFVADNKGQIIEVNQVSCRITGYSHEELLARKVFDLSPEEAHHQANEHFGRVVDEGKVSGVIPYLTKSGEKRYWNVNAVKISDSRIVGFVNDITEERAIRARLTRLSQIFEHSLNEIYLFDTQTYRFLEVNPASLKNTGYSHTEIRNMTPLDLKLNMTAEEFEMITVSLKNGEKQGVVFETQHFRKDGSFYDAEIHLQLVGQGHDKQ
ncbi:MAG: PAS domain S-box protein, partial [Bacteroidia bacterium]|nr:PAS domain S-box protein [Bacteroidia bacterium]